VREKIPELTYGDTEIGVISECYKSLRMLDRDGQNRALDWLHSRLEDDATVKTKPSTSTPTAAASEVKQP